MDRPDLSTLRIVAFIIGAVAAAWTYTDATSLRQRGAKLTPGLWAVLSFVAAIIAVPVYLILRFTVWQNQVCRIAGNHLDDAPEMFEDSSEVRD
jgi:hypothetical protein